LGVKVQHFPLTLLVVLTTLTLPCERDHRRRRHHRQNACCATLSHYATKMISDAYYLVTSFRIFVDIQHLSSQKSLHLHNLSKPAVKYFKTLNQFVKLDVKTAASPGFVERRRSSASARSASL